MPLGLGMPNARYRKYSQRDLAAVRDLQPWNLLFIAYPDDETQFSRIRQESALCDDIGVNAPYVRVYRPTVKGLDPVQAAEEDASLFNLYRDAFLLPQWIPWNEMTIEGWGENWVAQIVYARAYIHAFRERVGAGSVVVHLPALSPTGNYLDGYEAYRYAGLDELFDRQDRHVYDQGHLLWGTSVSLVITEWNQLPAQLISESGRENFYFLLDSDDPDFHQYSLLRNPALYADFKAWAGQGTGQPAPGTPPESSPTNGGTMTKDELWEQLTAPFDTFPALSKPIIAKGGVCIGTEVIINGYTYQLGQTPRVEDFATIAPVVSWAKTGDWGNVKLAFKASELPPL